MTGIRQNAPGVLACLAIAVPAWFLGKLFPVVGGAVIAILAGMAVTMVWKHKGALEQGIGFPSKKVLQWAVVLLGFGLDLTVILQTGRQSLPIIVCTIGTSLALSCALHRAIRGIGDHHRGGGRWGARRMVLSHQGTQQVFDRPCNGRHWTEQQFDQTHQNRRKTSCFRGVLLAGITGVSLAMQRLLQLR